MPNNLTLPVYQLTPAALTWLRANKLIRNLPKPYAFYVLYADFGTLLKLVDLENRGSVIFALPSTLVTRLDLTNEDYRRLLQRLHAAAILRQQMTDADTPDDEIEAAMNAHYRNIRKHLNLAEWDYGIAIRVMDTQTRQTSMVTLEEWGRLHESNARRRHTADVRELRDTVAAFVNGDRTHGDTLQDYIRDTQALDLLNELLDLLTDA